jgi:outer membrane protein OmpA-like peptidoglycan-associated protein
MSWWRRLLLPAALVVLAVVPARAQVAGHPFEVSAGAGINDFDSRDAIKDSPVFNVSGGWRWSDAVTFEAAWLRAAAKLDQPGEEKHDWSYTSVDALWMMRDPSERTTPYLLAGFGLGRSLDNTHGILRGGAPSLGIGFRYNLAGNPRTYLRLQARDVMFRERNSQQFSQHVAVTAALTWVFKGRVKDQDLDGVRNWLDQCPNTPLGAKVDVKGCPIDTDGDGVFDGIDQCVGTPKGCKVDAKGCPIDTDGDGVCDGVDQCENTPKGAVVDAKGCPIDTDGDGVFDGLDQCENTPKGAVVDTTGCPVDTDGDGVADGIDQCPSTPAGLRVDTNGCPIEVSVRETELLDTGTIRLQGINFDTGRATIKAPSDTLLDEVAKILLQYPALTLEIGGHTDNQGTPAKNLSLSDARAKAVLAFLTQKYPTLDATHFTVKGFGQTAPVAPNGTALGRAKNRRVEFKVTNVEVLKTEREKRHFLRKDEGAPADSTKH